MKRISILTFLFSLPIFLSAQESIPVAPNLVSSDKNPKKINPITVEYPHQNAALPLGSKNAFILGKITPASGSLTINGVAVPVFKTGAFLAYLPVTPGNFDFILELKDNGQTHKVKRTVKVLGFDYRPYENRYRFDGDYTYPQDDLELTTQDAVEFSVAGSPKRKVSISIPPLYRDIQMEEVDEDPGVYKKTITFSQDKQIKRPTKAIYTMQGEDGQEKAQAFSRGRIKITAPQDSKRAARIKNKARALPAPNPYGRLMHTKLFGDITITGKKNNFYRVNLDDDNIAWVAPAAITTPRRGEQPLNTAWEVSAKTAAKDKTTITIKNTQKVSFKIEEKPEAFEIYLFYTKALDTLINDTEDPLVKAINYEVLSDKTKKLIFKYKEGQNIWGYKVRYEGNNLIFDLYHKPAFAFSKEQPLKGLKIVLDPGHSPKRTPPYDGAIGPSGTLEYEVNYKIAKVAQQKLKEKGAEVILTKEEDEKAAFKHRVKKVDDEDAKLFISIHNNALADNVNPFDKDRGFSIYYYYPHSMAFAQSMERSFIRNIALPSNGVLEGNFYVTRNLPQVPALLIENLYLMFPEQEDLLKKDDFIQMLAGAIAGGVIDFVNPDAIENKPTIVPQVKKD
ncbi:MAG: N-acetylmuramoyl-L-alanine amidase [Elusimicrobiota bacterium]|jgi:N-acetylmuramoyl-L-alanine amidase|nr:N-acetylmuramoyl-L-alanine amidase [Elusimicrobiota bacterium]